MEFPEDILRLIREYARPRMRFIHEYNEIVRLLGVEWYPVKKKLQGPDAIAVLDQFAYYADAVVMAQSNVPVLAECTDHMDWLVASRKHIGYLEVVEARLQHLERLLK